MFGISYSRVAHTEQPTNLLLKSSEDLTDVKIADFGLSKILGDNTMMQTACGTPIYVGECIGTAKEATSHQDIKPLRF